MTSLKMWCFLPITALLLLPVVPTATEVVRSMSDCTGFLLEETPPQVPGVLEGGNILNQNRYKAICQTFENERRFVTLYDTVKKIPVFSAAKFRGGGTKRPETPWKIEPQLEDEDGNRNMIEDENKKYTHQAKNIDYCQKQPRKYDRGHLFPSSYGYAETDRKSTFTLTNIVPQVITFNKGSWNKMENCIRCVMNKYCINNNGNIEGFVVTGAQPGTNNLPNNRVNIPSMLWSAFCCYSRSENGWLASAHWGNNVPDESKDKNLQTKTLAELEEELSTPTSEFKVFPGTQCPLHTTVSPTLKANCKCAT